ncbi:uncharacterized protein LOC132205314 [Neocloeon triangulifer]|uniref:uncharacterized protein LOC132205314 n=1 Tax=Neocloeon triangulifer TaxID=2078957 RepID=UPI00286EFED1|nr:uncharacterized protein LOC132205314 [Neocloeon triangulifer]
MTNGTSEIATFNTTSANEILSIPPSSMEFPTFSCEINSSEFNSDGSISISSNPAVDGVYRVACGNLYFFSNSSKNWSEAYSDCCKRNMSLLKFENDAEHSCISTSIIARKYYYFETDANWWIGASDMGNESIYKWVYSTMLTTDLNLTQSIKFVSGQPNSSCDVEDCLAGVIVASKVPPNNLLLDDLDCSTMQKYICESQMPKPAPFPECDNSLCVSDNTTKTLVLLANQIVNQIISQNLTLYQPTTINAVFFRACNSVYFYLKSFITWSAAITECCKYGFSLLSVENYEEHLCLVNFNNSTLNAEGTFWTSGTNQGVLSENNYGYCSNSQLIDQSPSFWKSGQPNSPWLERCLSFDLRKASLGANGLSDQLCTNKLYPICKLNKF